MYEYRSETVSSNYGSTGVRIAELATKRGAEGWRLIVAAPKHDSWELIFERALLTREEHLTPPEARAQMNPDRSGSITDAPPLEVPSSIECPPEPGWREEFQKMIRDQGERLAHLEQIIRRRDEVIAIVRRVFKDWTINSKHYIDDEVEELRASLARLEKEESP
jgi:hypothetical protein